MSKNDDKDKLKTIIYRREVGDSLIDPANISSLKILLIERSKNFASSYEMMIRHAIPDLVFELQFKSDIVGSLPKAINMFKQGHYDIIFIKIGIPVKKWSMTIKKLREIEQKKGYRRTPIIGISDCDPHSRDEYIESGIDVILSATFLEARHFSEVFENFQLINANGRLK